MKKIKGYGKKDSVLSNAVFSRDICFNLCQYLDFNTLRSFIQCSKQINNNVKYYNRIYPINKQVFIENMNKYNGIVNKYWNNVALYYDHFIPIIYRHYNITSNEPLNGFLKELMLDKIYGCYCVYCKTWEFHTNYSKYTDYNIIIKKQDLNSNYKIRKMDV